MAIEDAQAQGGENQQACARKQNSDQSNGQLALFSVEAKRDRVDQVGRCRTPIRTMIDVVSAKSPAIAPAVRRASSSSFRASRPAYTGIKEAESTPSPNRFCRKLGMRNAALKASAASELPK